MNIYFSGIGGVGIGPLAEMARDAGHTVQGSDLVRSLITDELQSQNVPIMLAQDGEFLQARHDIRPIDLLVYTVSLPDNHPELVLARQLGIKCVKRDELIRQIIEEKNLKLIAVSGAHGKTTTTGMFIWAMRKLNIPVSYSIGTTLQFGPSGKYDPDSEYFVYECDEFDRNFLQFHPFLSIIPSIEYDHPDTYANEQEYFDAFVQFADQSEQVITWNDQHSEIFDGKNNVTIVETPREIVLAGAHNRRNASLVIAGMETLGISENIMAALESFPGTDRRFERLANNLYSDYGHTPTEIAATLQMAHELSSNVVLVYQPHQNIRQHEIRGQYTDQFELANHVYWVPTYLSREEDSELEILKPEDLFETVTNKYAVTAADLNDQLWQQIQAELSRGALVICMGAGTIDEWVREHLHV